MHLVGAGMRHSQMAVAAILALSMMGGDLFAGTFSDQFQRLDRARWHVAEYDFNHPMFDTDWRSANVAVSDGLRLSLLPDDGNNRFSGASVRRTEPAHFGWYEATLTAARGDGVITGFFLYTGAQHDEIDWEFFGRDTTTAQVAWFRDGVLRSQKIELGFDAADGPNTYAINWQSDALEWFVNGALVFRTTKAIPQTPQMVFANVWAVAPELEAWAGLADPSKAAEATVHNLRAISTGN